MGTERFSHYENEQIRQLLIEAEVQRFTGDEILAFVRGRLKRDISMETLYKRKAAIRQYTESKYLKLQKDRMAYISLFFENIDEIKKYQKEQWRLYHTHPDKPFLQTKCLQELHQTTKTLANLYDLLPHLTMPYSSYAHLSESDEKEGQGNSLMASRAQQAEPDSTNFNSTF